MDYPIKTDYQGYVIYEYKSEGPENKFQAFDNKGKEVTLLCATMEEAQNLIRQQIKWLKNPAAD